MTATLYRPFDAQGRLLYVGVSEGLFLRLGQHRAESAWAPFAVNITLERFDDRLAALEAELHAIRAEDPVFNKNGRPLSRWRQWMAVYPDGNPPPPSSVPSGTQRNPGLLTFQSERFNTAMAALGHSTESARATAAGVHRATLHRWRTRPIESTPTNAHQVAARARLTVDDLFVAIAA